MTSAHMTEAARLHLHNRDQPISVSKSMVLPEQGATASASTDVSRSAGGLTPGYSSAGDLVESVPLAKQDAASVSDIQPDALKRPHAPEADSSGRDQGSLPIGLDYAIPAGNICHAVRLQHPPSEGQLHAEAPDAHIQSSPALTAAAQGAMAAVTTQTRSAGDSKDPIASTQYQMLPSLQQFLAPDNNATICHDLVRALDTVPGGASQAACRVWCTLFVCHTINANLIGQWQGCRALKVNVHPFMGPFVIGKPPFLLVWLTRCPTTYKLESHFCRWLPMKSRAGLHRALSCTWKNTARLLRPCHKADLWWLPHRCLRLVIVLGDLLPLIIVSDCNACN